MRDNEERWKETEERLRVMEDRMEREVSRKTGEERRSKEWTRNMEEEVAENENEIIKERIKVLEDMVKDGEKFPGKKDREAYVRINKLENNMAKDRAERQEYEWNMEEDQGIQDTKDSEKDMEGNWRELWSS